MRKQATLGDYITRMFNKDLETRDRLKLAEAVDNLPPGEAEALAQELAGGEKKDPPKKDEGEKKDPPPFVKKDEDKKDEEKEASFEFDPNTPEFLQKAAEADGLGRRIAQAQVKELLKEAADTLLGSGIYGGALGGLLSGGMAASMNRDQPTEELARRAGRAALLGSAGGALGGAVGHMLPIPFGSTLGALAGGPLLAYKDLKRQEGAPREEPPTVAAQPGPEEPAKVGSARVADYAGKSIEDRVSNPGVFDHVTGALTHPKLAPVIGGVAGVATGLVGGDMLGNSLVEKALYGIPLAAIGGKLGASLGGRSARARDAAGVRRYLQETGETPKVGSAIPLEVYYRMLGKE